jgi:uncharacterized flavoprotein (TIGR03862 family)
MPVASAPTAEPVAAVIGGGPAGLMAAQVLLEAGVAVDLYDAMPTVGRKFLLAGKGGLNLTHAEPLPAFVSRYGERARVLDAWLQAFGPEEVRQWAAGLGVQTFVGSSLRIFPTDMKAAPLLRAWLQRLRAMGLRVHARQRWIGFGPQGTQRLRHGDSEQAIRPRVTVMALGGGSWPHLGSDGAWQAEFLRMGVAVRPLAPSNCGFDTQPWSEHLRQHHAGAPLKSVALAWHGPGGQLERRRGEFVLTESGVEGSLVYAASSDLREAIAAAGQTQVYLNLLPDHAPQRVQQALQQPRGSKSLSAVLRSRLGLSGVKAALLHECVSPQARADPASLAAAIQHLPITLLRPRPLAEAISSAGGVPFEALDDQLMLRGLAGVFCAGEMLDWEAPTGGYLLTACLSTGRVAGEGARRWLARVDT